MLSQVLTVIAALDRSKRERIVRRLRSFKSVEINDGMLKHQIFQERVSGDRGKVHPACHVIENEDVAREARRPAPMPNHLQQAVRVFGDEYRRIQR